MREVSVVRTRSVWRGTRALVLVAVTLCGLTALALQPARAAPGVQGEVPTLGVGLLVTSEPFAPNALVTSLAEDGCAAVTIGVFAGGQFAGYIPGAPSFVNADFPSELAAGTPFVVRCFPVGPTPPSTTQGLADLPAYAVYEAEVGTCTFVVARLPQDAFDSLAGPEGRLLMGVYNSTLGQGLSVGVIAEIEAGGINFDGTSLAGDAPECGSGGARWTAEQVGTGLQALRARLNAAGIFLQTSTLDLVEQAQGFELTDEVRSALTN